MKPDRITSMQQLIEQIRQAIPFSMSSEELCSGLCVGCPKKLVEYLDGELDHWQSVLSNGESPTLGDIHKLAKTSKKIHASLKKNQII